MPFTIKDLVNQFGGQSGLVKATLPNVVEEIEIRSAVSPPVIIKTRDLVEGKPTEAPFIAKRYKPTLILRGPILGAQTVAPFGEVDPNAWKLNLTAIALTLMFTGSLLAASFVRAGRVAERRKRRRRRR